MYYNNTNTSKYFCISCNGSISTPSKHYITLKHRKTEKKYIENGGVLFNLVTVLDDKDLHSPIVPASCIRSNELIKTTTAGVNEPLPLPNEPNPEPDEPNPESEDNQHSDIGEGTHSRWTDDFKSVFIAQKFDWNDSQQCILCHYEIQHDECLYPIIEHDYFSDEKNSFKAFSRKQFNNREEFTYEKKEDLDDENLLAYRLRKFMIKYNISEHIMRKLLKLLQFIHANDLFAYEIPSLYKVKKSDRFTNAIPISTVTLKNQVSFSYIEPITIIESLFHSKNNINKCVTTFNSCLDDEYYSTFYNSKNYRAAKAFFTNKHIDFNYCEMRSNNNLLVPIAFFIDAFKLNQFHTSVNTYYLTVYLDTNDILKFPIAVEPINQEVDTCEIFERLIGTTVENLTQGSLKIKISTNQSITIYGYLHSIIGDDMGMREIFKFTSAHAYFCNRFYVRNKLQFSDIVPMDTSYEEYKINVLKDKFDIYNILNIYYNYQNGVNTQQVELLLKIYGISMSQKTLSPFFLLQDTLYLDYPAYSPVCELHIFRLGICKDILYLFGQLYGKKYRSSMNIFSKKLFSKYLFSKDGNIGVHITGKDIKKLIPLLSHYYKTLKYDDKLDLLIMRQATSFFNAYSKTHIWDNSMLDNLQEFLVAFKTNLITRFGAGNFKNPNFEGLDYIPHTIANIGSLQICSTETYESMHKLVGRYLITCNQSNRSKYVLYKIQKYVQYKVHKCSES